MWMNVLLALFGFVTFLYFYITRNYGYFRSQGIPEVPSKFPFGSAESAKVFTGKMAFLNMNDDIYKQYKKLPMVGYFSIDRPILLVNDLELAKLIMIKDFDHFVDRRKIELDESVHLNRYMTNMLTSLEGEKWKHMRSTMSPVFTSGKLKAMAQLISKVGDDFVVNLTEKSKSQEDINAKDMMVNYMLDSIATCGFGVEANSLTDPNSKFKAMVVKLLGLGTKSPINIIKILTLFFLPKVAKLLKLEFFERESVTFFMDVIRQSMAHRKENKIRRNDFIDLTIDAMKNEAKQDVVVEDDQFEKDAVVKTNGSNNNNTKMTEEEFEVNLIANLLLLFIAGFDTSSTILAICTHFLAKHQEVQERLCNEINDNLTEKDLKNLDYNNAQSLQYLDMFVNECLRLYPLTFIERRCSKPYKMPGTDFTIPKDMLVQIPSGPIMNDEQYFRDPDNFDPEHFSPENKSQRNPYAFLAFGQGPRNCIGMRFALMSIKICLIRLIKDFKVVPSPKTPEKLIPDPMSQSATPIGGSWFKVEKRMN